MAGVIDLSKRAVGFDLQEPVISVDWSPDGRHLAVAGTDGALVIADAADGTIRHRLGGHRFGAMQVAWSPDDSWIASAGQDGRVKLWNPQNGELGQILPGGSAWVEHLAWSRDGGALISAAGKILRRWNAGGELQFEFTDHESTITALQWRADGKGFATACYGKIRCFRLGEQRPYETLDWKSSLISMAWSPNGRYLAAGTQENTIQFYRLPVGGKEPLQMSGYPGKVRHLAWDHTSQYLATNSAEMVTVWDVSGKGPAGTIPLQLSAHAQNISALAWQQQGGLLATGCEAGVLLLWHPAKCSWPSTKPKPVEEHVYAMRLASAINQLRWSPDETKLAIGCQDGTVTLLQWLAAGHKGGPQ